MAKKRFPVSRIGRWKFSLPPGFQESIVVELRYEAPVASAKDKFVGLGEGVAVADRLNEVLEQKDVAEIRPSFTVKPRI